MKIICALAAILFGLSLSIAGQKAWQPAPEDKSPHTSVTGNGIRLHYLDWGGKGEALLFLAGSGDNAHAFDEMAPKFTDRFRVLALTRRGYGESDKPETGCDVATLTGEFGRYEDRPTCTVSCGLIVGQAVN